MFWVGAMDTNFWHQRWEKNEIAFHESEVNPYLLRYFKDLSLVKGSRVFLPLCGKTLAISWLLSNGYHVAGAELSELAVKQLFVELKVEPEISKLDQVKCYSAKNIDIFAGDIFHLLGDALGPVDAIYDRAGLVALPEEMRKRYAVHLRKITGQAPQLLICYEYDQSLMEGPPFSISNEEIDQHYSHSYKVTLLESAEVSGGLKGKFAAKENIWLLNG